MMFIHVHLIPDTGDNRRNDGVGKTAACEEIAQLFTELVPFQAFESGRPFLGCFIGESIVIHAFCCRSYSLIVESLLAKFHRHQPAAARAESTSVLYPRACKLIVVCQPTLPQPLKRVLNNWFRNFMLAQVLSNLGFGTGAVAQKEHGLLECPFTRILKQQPFNFFIIQFLANCQPRSSNTCQPEGELPIEIDVYSIRTFLLRLYSRNFLH